MGPDPSPRPTLPPGAQTPIAHHEPVRFGREHAAGALEQLWTRPGPPVDNRMQDPNLTVAAARGFEGPVRATPAQGLSVSQSVAPNTEARTIDANAAPQPPAARQTSGVGPPAPPEPPSPERANVMTPGRRQSLQQASGIVRDVTIGKGTSEHPWALAGISQSTEGALAVADALELSVTGNPKSTMNFLDALTRNQDSTRGFSYAMANAAHVAPERAVGTMLLVTDAPGGRDAISNLFKAFGQDQPASQNLASILEASSRTPAAARGMVELMDVLTQPEGDNWNHASDLAQALSRSTDYVHGSKHVAQTFLNTLEAEGGSRSLATMLNRMSRTPEGSDATRNMLLNMSFDREGSQAVGKMLARASTSRSGAAEVLDGLMRMSQTAEGQKDVARLLNRVAQVPEGGRFLSHLFKDGANADGLANLFEQLGKNDDAKYFVNSAFESIASNRRTLADAEIIRGRLEASSDLKGVMDKLWTGEKPSRSSGLDPNSYQDAATAEASLLNATRDSVSMGGAAPASSGGGGGSEGAGGGGGGGGGGTVYLPQTGAPGSGTPNLAPSTAEQPAPQAQAQASEQVGAVREKAYGDSVREQAHMDAVQNASEERQVRETTETAAGDKAREAQQTERSEKAQKDEDRLYSFRPGDVYSEDTLRMLRICAECGFRTSAAGLCPRCAAGH
ncbi:MAG: hypothetical protein AB1758_31310 [Candidatus Eremiobacterota bacterium]